MDVGVFVVAEIGWDVGRQGAEGVQGADVDHDEDGADQGEDWTERQHGDRYSIKDGRMVIKGEINKSSVNRGMEVIICNME